jgi:hypothetical protein
MLIPKPSQDNYTNLKAYCSISLLSCLRKVVLKVVMELLTEEADRRGLLSDRQIRSQNGQSTFDAVAIMV